MLTWEKTYAYFQLFFGIKIIAYYVALENRAEWKFNILNAIFSKLRNVACPLLPQHASNLTHIQICILNPKIFQNLTQILT